MKLLILLLLFPLALNAQIDVNLHIGESRIKGNIGSEIRIYHWSVSGGYYFSQTPIPKSTVIGYAAAVTYYQKSMNWKEYRMSTFYISAGILTNAWADDKKTGQFVEVPSASVVAGFKIYPQDITEFTRRLSCTCGVGLEANKYRIWTAFEFIVNYTLFK
jgi:hypothetical protein